MAGNSHTEPSLERQGSLPNVPQRTDIFHAQSTLHHLLESLLSRPSFDIDSKATLSFEYALPDGPTVPERGYHVLTRVGSSF